MGLAEGHLKNLIQQKTFGNLGQLDVNMLQVHQEKQSKTKTQGRVLKINPGYAQSNALGCVIYYFRFYVLKQH